jgi:putative SOS response-associated peptidase YedK
MCGRYVRDVNRDEAVKHFGIVDGLDYFDIHGYKASAEVFPGTEIFAINNEHRPEDVWWTIEDKDHKGIWRRTINAKSESVLWVPMFKDAFLHDRILVPATGFFEWDARKQRYEFKTDEPVFAFGGIARDCQIRGEIKRCAVILTTAGNEVVRPIHPKDRMPVIIHKRDYQKWLDPATPIEELERLMQPLADDELHAKPVKEDDIGRQTELFA